MDITSKHFGIVEIDEDKILTFEHGIMGFEELRKFAIVYDSEEDKGTISWLQSLEEEQVAIPVIDPYSIKQDYNPIIEDHLLEQLGTTQDQDLFLLLILNVPKDIKNITANLVAPIIVNSITKKGCQLIVENKDYEVRYNIYEAVKQIKEQAGD